MATLRINYKTWPNRFILPSDFFLLCLLIKNTVTDIVITKITTTIKTTLMIAIVEEEILAPEVSSIIEPEIFKIKI